MNPTSIEFVSRAILCGTIALAAAAAAARPVAGPQTVAVDLSAYAAVYYVDAVHGDDVTGTGAKERPWRSLPHALEECSAATVEKRIALLLSAGRYTQPTFVLRSHVDLFGGFAAPGGERDVFAHATLLDGENARRIAFGADDVRVDGVHFVRGRIRGKGAALLCDGTSPTVSNCVFAGNRTLIPEPWAPPLLHETAHDGGAVMCVNGAAPRLEYNYFFHNTTECGRGAGVAADRRASPQIVGSVFAHNRAGLDDPMRSSDGGAISVFDRAQGEISGNVIVANEALTHNDAGGVFIALWSAPRVTDNVIVANESGDDAGGLFIGGQEHRYDAPLDAYPPADQFEVIVTGNVLVGNVNSSRNSGATRITMESRVRLTDNLIAENAGGLYLQRSEIFAERNTVWQDWRFVEDKPSLGASRFSGNIFKGPAGVVDARATFTRNMIEPAIQGSNNVPPADIFVADGVKGELTAFHFDRVTLTTTLQTRAPLPAGASYVGRPIRLGDNPAAGGQWRVIKSASGTGIVLWGQLEAVTSAPGYFEILRTFTPRPDAPADLGARMPRP